MVSNNSVDIVLVAPPVPELEALDNPHIPTGIATINACVKQAGFTTALLDLNMHFAKRYGFGEDHKSLLQESNSISESAYIICKRYARQIVEYNPKWVGFSLLFNEQFRATFEISKLIKRHRPDIKIMVGGPGINYTNESFASFKRLNKSNIINDVIVGPGDRAVINVLNNIQLDPNAAFSRDMSQVPFRDFNDMNFNEYQNVEFSENNINPILFPITYSEGCVFRCTFCTLGSDSYYAFKGAKQVSDEMLHMVYKYKAKLFRFTDSLLNASVPKFRELLLAIIEARNTLPDHQKFTWMGNFVTKKKDKFSVSDYDLLKQSGCTQVWVGLESGSEKIRKDMRMHFENTDIKFAIEQTNRVGIKFAANLIYGYPTETETEFQETMDLLEVLNNNNAILRAVREMMLKYNSPIWNEGACYGIDTNELTLSSKDWYTANTPDNTPHNRAIRGIRIFYKIHELGIHLQNYNVFYGPVVASYKRLENSVAVPDDINIVDLYNIVKENHTFE